MNLDIPQIANPDTINTVGELREQLHIARTLVAAIGECLATIVDCHLKGDAMGVKLALDIIVANNVRIVPPTNSTPH